MSPRQTRRKPKILYGRRDEDPEEASTEEEEEEDAEEEEVDVKEEAKIGSKRPKILLNLKIKGACKVCHRTDHKAGFVGEVYLDCPNKPCFLCRQPGHTTATCPHRIAPEAEAGLAQRRVTGSLLDMVMRREVRGRSPQVRKWAPFPKLVNAAVMKLHSRRVTVLEFHSTHDNLLLSGDKRGEVGVWDIEKVFSKRVMDGIHRYTVTALKQHPDHSSDCFTSSLDGSLARSDIEVGAPDVLANLNPGGWVGDESSWRSFYSMSLNHAKNVMLAGDDVGNLHMVDIESRSRTLFSSVHKKGTKVVTVDSHPRDENLMITGGNDRMAKLWDLRHLDPKECLTALPHGGVVNSAYFSPETGRKVLTTCQDNKIRVWDYLYADMAEPSRAIVHSHDFNRYLTAFKAEWDPKDHTEGLISCGRYISDVYDGLKRHPVDLLDASTGEVVAVLTDPSLPTICPVNKFHPRLNLIASGSSRNIFIWRPEEEEEEKEVRDGGRKGRENGGGGSSRRVSVRIYDEEAGGGGEEEGEKEGVGRWKW